MTEELFRELNEKKNKRKLFLKKHFLKEKKRMNDKLVYGHVNEEELNNIEVEKSIEVEFVITGQNEDTTDLNKVRK